MNSNQKNRPYPRVQEEKTVIDDAHAGARRGSLIGALAGGAAGGMLSKRRKLYAGAIGALAGGALGHDAGRRIGAAAGARDVKDARRALRQSNQLAALHERLAHLEQRSFDRSGNAMEPGLSGQHPVPIFPKSKRKDTQQVGIDDQGDYALTEERQALADEFGWAIIDALPDEMLTREHAQALLEEVRSKMAKANGPRASSNTDPEFARAFLGPNASQMSDAEAICHFESARRRGLIQLDSDGETTALAILTRERNDAGQFVDNDAVDSQAIQRAYHPRDRKTGISGPVAAGATAAGLLSVAAHLRGKKRRAPRLTAGSPPTLPGAIGDFAARNDDSHPVRDTIVGAGAGALGVVGALALRKRRRLRLAPGVPKLPPKTIDVDAESLSRRVPFLTSLAMRSCAGPGSYRIARRTLRGRKQPGVPKVKMAGKTDLAFMIHDPDFPIVPMKQQKLAPGMRQRVPVAKSRAEVLRRLRAMTQLSIGSAVAEGAIDALGLGAATTPKKKKLLIDANGNVINPQFLPDPGTTSTSSFASALARLHEFGFGSTVTGGVLRDAGIIAGADLTAEELHDAIQQARQKKKLLRQSGGIQATPGMGTSPGVQTTMSSVHDTLVEFDSDASRDRARKRAGELGAASVGGAAGAYAGLATHRPGRPVQPGEDLRGKRVYVRRKSPLPSDHVGIGGEEGVVHRTPGRDSFREVKGGSFRKIGKGGLRVEDIQNGKSPAENARAASSAKGAKAGRYSISGNNCEHGADRIVGGRGVSRQVRRAIGGAAIGAAAAGGVASILNRKNRKDK